jgi:hypothetical protein
MDDSYREVGFPEVFLDHDADPGHPGDYGM